MTPDADASTVAADSSPADRTAFADVAAARLREAQAAMTELLVGAGLGGARPTEVGRELGLDKTLAWKVSRFVEDADPVKAARHMPGQGGVEIVLKAASLRGVAPGRLDAVRLADTRLRRFVEQQAGDRRSFEAMLAAGGRDEKLEFEERRAYYKAGSAIWGVRARAQFLMLALRPSETEPGYLDGVQISGLVEMERLRPDVPWIMRRLRASTDSGKQMLKMTREPLDPSGATGDGLPLVPEFCSRPLPEIRQFEGANGMLYDEIVPGAVGRRSAVTCITGEIYRSAIPSVYSEDNRYGLYTLTVRTPVETVLFDLLLHRSLTHFEPAVASVVGLLEDRPGSSASGSSESLSLLSGSAPAMTLGSPPVLQTPRLSKYAAMAEGALSRAGWGLDEFVGYRCEVEYPAAPCDVALRCEIRP
ncbi:MAG: hypothetical protein AAF138_00700 [Planctomycetota bacterium]